MPRRSAASIRSPVSSISMACLALTLRDSATIGVEQKSPMLTPGVAKRADAAATARSHDATSWHPAAVATPATFAITGWRSPTTDIIRSEHCSNSASRNAGSGWAWISRRSWPAENAGPLPARTTTFTERVAIDRRQLVLQRPHQADRQGVAGLRPVQGQGGDAPGVAAQHDWFVHAADRTAAITPSPAGRTRSVDAEQLARTGRERATAAAGPGRADASGAGQGPEQRVRLEAAAGTSRRRRRSSGRSRRRRHRTGGRRSRSAPRRRGRPGRPGCRTPRRPPLVVGTTMSVSGVWIIPGATALTRTAGASSRAADWVRFSTPALAAEYGASPRSGGRR